jgi:hypothetical protein
VRLPYRRLRRALLALPVVALALPGQPIRAQPPGPGSAMPLPAPPGRTRVALLEFLLEGDAAASPALSMQLQDGFSLGLVRGGIDLIDPTDVKKRLAVAPELLGCETSPCFKRMAEVLAVRLVVRVRVQVTGNSYKMTGRLFSTEGPTPAALPLAAQSRACDVCTVGEARAQMLRLADGLRARIEEASAPPAPATAPPPPHRLGAIALIATGLAAIVGGALVMRDAPDVGKRQPALGGALMGAGVPLSVFGLWLAVRERPTSTEADLIPGSGLAPATPAPGGLHPAQGPTVPAPIRPPATR